MAATRAFDDADERWMRAALVEAEGALNRWEVPVGCVVVRDGEVIATGSNRTNELRNGTRHAEFEAIDAILARPEVNDDASAAGFDRCDLYVTCEPCIMCAGALSLLGFRSVTFGCGNDKFGGNGSILAVHETGVIRAASRRRRRDTRRTTHARILHRRIVPGAVCSRTAPWRYCRTFTSAATRKRPSRTGRSRRRRRRCGPRATRDD